MWWSRKIVAPGAALLVAGALLAACGYRPLYGSAGGGQQGAAIQRQMAAVQIGPIRDRVGQLLRNRLIDRLTPAGQPGSARYELEIRLDESRENLAVRRDETATRANLRLYASFRLRDLSNGVVLYTGRSQATTSYNLVQSDFATESAVRDARERGTVLLAEDITTQIALYFNRRLSNPNE